MHQALPSFYIKITIIFIKIKKIFWYFIFKMQKICYYFHAVNFCVSLCRDDKAKHKDSVFV